MKVEGRLERVWLHQAEGWAWLPAEPGKRLTVELYVDDALVATAPADILRADLARKSIGDGRYGFSLPLPGKAGSAGAAKSVSVRIVDGPELRGRIDALTVPPNGRIETRNNLEIRGWAHGPNYEPAELEVFADGVLQATWPCRMLRKDPAFKHLGANQFGFKMPLDPLVGPNADRLEVRIKGTSMRLDVPAKTPAPDYMRVPADLPRQRYASAYDAREALLKSLCEDGADGGANTVTVSWTALQQVLNLLSARENALEERRFMSKVEERAGGLLPESGSATVESESLNKLLALSREAAGLTTEQLVERIAAELVPAYREDIEGRRSWHAALRSIPDKRFLRSLARAFRQSDFLELPGLAYLTSMAGRSSFPISSIRYARTLWSWAHASHEQGIRLPAPAAHVRSNRRRTAYVLWRSVPYDTNGYAMRSHYLLRSLKSLDEDVLGVTRLGYPWDAEKKKPATSYIEEIDGLPYIHLGGTDASRDTMTLENYVLECSQRIAHVAAAMETDVIHSASNWVAGLPALRAARLLGLPFCYEVRGLWEITRASTTPGYRQTDHFSLFERMEGLVARNADRVFAITGQVKAELVRRGVDESKIVLAPNGVETERFTPRATDEALKRELGIKDEIVFGFIGTFARYEGLIDLCRAATELTKRGKRFKLLLIGDGGVFDDVVAYKKEFDHENNIIVTGRIPFEQVPSYYSLVHVAVFPRASTEITEMVSPLKPFEAMAMAKPVIGSSVAPIAEFVDEGETGWLFEKGSLDDLVRVMSNVIDQPSMAEPMGRKARRFIEEKRDWKIIGNTIATGWQDIRSRGPHGPPS
ncbi:glycosyltransferase family 4 protein [Enterovirga rhinocerotis]|uniref:Glycosyltransferase involved in cell wall biosynthesis n=1 Tax=Enterovirga rhinocerotis TaxID=1339210 RepID=A0A4R7BZ01_9HYPH|nr:glycosyltransferase family 4 protein [Enterovirga rhinocerotis]TDR89286.1 glycosyltransferase involved in cell wall biosynthesis [Enterovirga rhinocerotis]